MMPALGLTDLQMGRIFSTFVVGYALCQIPGGWLGDRWGSRLGLAAAVVWWSVFTAMTDVAAMVALAGGLMRIKIQPGGGLRSDHEVGTVAP